MKWFIIFFHSTCVLGKIVHWLPWDKNINESVRLHTAITGGEVSSTIFYFYLFLFLFSFGIWLFSLIFFFPHLYRECINRVCEAAGLKTSKKRRCDKRIQQALSDTPNMNKAGSNATLRVSSKFLSLVGLENNETIAKHDMPRISFASGGDSVRQHIRYWIFWFYSEILWTDFFLCTFL